MPVSNDVYRGVYDETDQHVNMNIMKNIPNNIIGNIRKNSGNLNGVSADDESSDSDHEYFVYRNYFIGFLIIKIFLIQFFQEFKLLLPYSKYLLKNYILFFLNLKSLLIF